MDDTDNWEEVVLLDPNCQSLEVRSNWAQVSRQVNNQILPLMKGAQSDAQNMLSATYASLYDISGKLTGATGNLWQFKDDSGTPYYCLTIGLRTFDERPEPPSSDYSPFSDLLQISDRVIGEVLSLDCTAVFNYTLDASLRSLVPLPVPLLLVSQSSEYGVTHVESVRLGRRTEEGLFHTVAVEQDGSKSVSHRVQFGISSPLSMTSLQDTYTIAERMSVSLLDTTGEAT